MKEEVPYTMLKTADIVRCQRKKITSLANECGLSEVLSRALLIKYGWREEIAKSKFLQLSAEQIFNYREVNIKSLSLKMAECDVCCEECAPAQFCRISECGHGLCTECFGEYLETKLQEGAKCVEATCPD